MHRCNGKSSVNMRFASVVLLALVSVAAASFLPTQEGSSPHDDFRRYLNKHRRHRYDDIDNGSQDENIRDSYYRIRNLDNDNSLMSDERIDKWGKRNKNWSNEDDSSSSLSKNIKHHKWNNRDSSEENKMNRDSDETNRSMNTKIDERSLKIKQKVILQLLMNLQQKNINTELARTGDEFNPKMNIDKFDNKMAVIKFLKTLENNELLPKKEVFIPTNQIHQNQAAQLFTFLYSARDWTTLKKAAAWARDKVNSDKFAYVLSSVVLNHPTTQGVVLPALYEIIPHAFVPATTIQDLYKAKLLGLKGVTLHATTTNENRKNKNYNKNLSDDSVEDVDIEKKMNKITKKTIGTHNPNVLFADNDGSLDNKAGLIENVENRLSYFTEDIGINDLHARFHVQYPVFIGVNNNKNWFTSNMEDVNNVKLNTNKLDVKRGEAFYFTHQQLYARYVLERLSNNLPVPRVIDLDDKIETGYNPNLMYTNGKAVPARPPMTKILLKKVENVNNNNDLTPNNNQQENPKVLEKRIMKVAESGIVLNKDGTKTKLTKNNAVGVLANLMAAPASSLNPDYYGDYFSAAKNVIGNIVDPNNQNGVAPGAISNYLMAARDPAYYQLLGKLNKIFKSLQNKLGPYTHSQLSFTGVKIEKIEVTDLVTYLDTTTINVDNALIVNMRNGDTDINGRGRNMNDDLLDQGNYKVKIQRLTNKPFEIKLTILSNKKTNAIIRVFLGPKFDSNGQLFTLAQASQYFVQLDQFKVKLNGGTNTIVKHSMNTNVNVHNPATMKELWNRIEQGKMTNIKKSEHQVLGLPLRSQLPKGKRNGQEFILYAIINELNGNDNTNSDEDVSGSSSEESKENLSLHRNTETVGDTRKNDDGSKNLNNKIIHKIRDNRPVGFPLDRPIVDINYNTPNQYFKTVVIYHKIKNTM